jgi:hypothetical protein
MTNDQFPNDQTMTQSPRILEKALRASICGRSSLSLGICALELPWSLVLGHWTFLPISPTEDVEDSETICSISEGNVEVNS